MPDQNYYAILGIDSSASDKDIKKAFWSLAKKFHPDKNPGNEKTSEEKFKVIISAYEILIDQNKRRAYDRTLIAKRTSTKARQRKEPSERVKKDERYICRMILAELLRHNKQNAIQIYESLLSKIQNFSLDQFMSDADTRDCEFLLAEAYHQIGKLHEAEQLYRKLLERENKRAYFHHFAQEIKLMLKGVYIQYITNSNNSDEVLKSMEKILAMELPTYELAWIYKKAAETYYRLNDFNNAIESLAWAFKINPKLPGAKKIIRKLGLEYSIFSNQ
jgi:curved DNA-binding protein CbpA